MNDDLEQAFAQFESAAKKCLSTASANTSSETKQEESFEFNLDKFEEQKIVKIQSVARAKRDRARVQQIREQKVTKSCVVKEVC